MALEKLRQRFKYYLVGFGIGILVVFVMFGPRGCSWFPGNRVKNMIAEKPLFISDSLNEVMNCAGVSNKDIYDLLNENGSVNFSKSITDKNPKIYILEGEKNDADLMVTYALQDSTAEVIDFSFNNSLNCSSTLSGKTKSIIPLPDEDVRKIIESHELRILNKAYCQMECLGIDEQTILTFHQTATFSVEYSRPRLYPNPEYVMKGTINGTEIFVTYVIAEKRSRIADIFPSDCECGL